MNTVAAENVVAHGTQSSKRRGKHHGIPHDVTAEFGERTHGGGSGRRRLGQTGRVGGASEVGEGNVLAAAEIRGTAGEVPAVRAFARSAHIGRAVGYAP